MRFISKFKKGFTFVEILSVLIIIMILISSAAYNYKYIKMKARDHQRKVGVKTILNGMIIWHNDNPYSYPHKKDAVSTSGFPGTYFYKEDGSLYTEADFIPKYFSKPKEPSVDLVFEGGAIDNFIFQGFPVNCNVPSVDGSGAFLYFAHPCTSFSITACLENDKDPDRDLITHGKCNVTNSSYTLVSPP